MSSPSRRLKRLIYREQTLRENLMGDPNVWGAPPSDPEVDAALAYRVLIHAEIEQYLEELVSGTLASCDYLYRQYAELRLPGFCAVALHQAALFTRGDHGARTDFRPTEIAKSLPSALADARQWVERTAIANNHGLKGSNTVGLLGYIGVDRGALDPTLLGALDVLGGERGDAAHLSRREISRRLHRGSPPGAPRVRRLASPSDDVRMVEAVLVLLPGLDKIVSRALKLTI